MKLPIVILCAASLCGCSLPSQETVETTNPAARVELLFEKDGVKVYRFKDAGYYIYYTDARGSTFWEQHTGKTSYPKSVETVR